jgi:regulatory protein
MGGSASVKSIIRRTDTTFCVSVEVSNESGCECVEFVILEDLFDGSALDMGAIGENELYELDRTADVTAAYMSACASFAYTQGSLRSLYRKLIQKGFSKESSSMAIDIVESRGFVNEDDVAARRAEIMLSKLWGRSRILQKLREEGFSDVVIRGAIESIENTDFAENCAKVIEKRYPRIPEERYEREKMYASLVRMGYSSSDIKKALTLIENQE